MFDLSVLENVIDFFRSYGAGFIWILVFFIFSRLLLDFISKKVIRLAIRSASLKKEEVELRVKTIWSLLLNAGRALIYIVVAIMILDLFNVDIAPVLAGLGIVGVALGFGAQSVIKDFIAGVLMLFENQLNIGDEVQIGSLKGKVKKITPRSIVLQDSRKKIYYISNGSITSVINFSQKKISN